MNRKGKLVMLFSTLVLTGTHSQIAEASDNETNTSSTTSNQLKLVKNDKESQTIVISSDNKKTEKLTLAEEDKNASKLILVEDEVELDSDLEKTETTRVKNDLVLVDESNEDVTPIGEKDESSLQKSTESSIQKIKELNDVISQSKEKLDQKLTELSNDEDDKDSINITKIPSEDENNELIDVLKESNDNLSKEVDKLSKENTALNTKKDESIVAITDNQEKIKKIDETITIEQNKNTIVEQNKANLNETIELLSKVVDVKSENDSTTKSTNESTSKATNDSSSDSSIRPTTESITKSSSKSSTKSTIDSKEDSSLISKVQPSSSLLLSNDVSTKMEQKLSEQLVEYNKTNNKLNLLKESYSKKIEELNNLKSDLNKQEEERKALELQQSTQSNLGVTYTNNIPQVEPNMGVIATARQFIGVPYVWGGKNPGGFDCSGLVSYVYGLNGIALPSYTVALESCGTIIPVEQAQAGDLYFWGSIGSTYHVGIASGGGSYIHAPQPGEYVKEATITYFMPSFALRL